MARRSRPRSWLRGGAGVSLVELAITMAGLALVSAGMVSLFVGTTRIDQLQAADDTAQEAVRDARSLLGRDVREARRFTAIAPASFTLWLDDEWDGLMPDAELVTWTVDPSGQLVRASGDGSARVEAWGLSPADSGFTFDSTTPAQVTQAYVHLVVQVAGSETAYRTLDFQVSLRNAP